MLSWASAPAHFEPGISMDRRNFNFASITTLGLFAFAVSREAHALSLADLSNAEAGQGLKAALEKGATVAVGVLGRPGGFLDNAQVRIPLPGFLANGAKFL